MRTTSAALGIVISTVVGCSSAGSIATSTGGISSSGGTASSKGGGGVGGASTAAISGGGAGTGTGATMATGGASMLCEPGATQICVGPGACLGGQACNSDGMAWGVCDCGEAGGASSMGGTGTPATGGTSFVFMTGGAGVFATGGSTAISSSTQPDSCADLTPPMAAGSLTVSSGYVTAGALHGYGFTEIDSRSNSTTCITPRCGTTACSPSFGASSLCAAGVVTADTTLNSKAFVRFNINQSSRGTAPGSLQAPASLTFTATKGSGTGDAAARVEVVDDSNNTYCVEAGDWISGTPIHVSRFNTKCWDGSGAALTEGTLLTEVDIAVPSDTTADRPFALCLTDVAFDGSTISSCNSNVTSTGCTPGQMTTTGSLSGSYGSYNATIGSKKYFLQVNEWGSSAAQTVSYGGNYFYKMTQQQASLTNSGAPAGYPSMFIGANSNHTTNDPGLPKQVSQLTNVLTSWTWNDGGTATDTTKNIFNATYDVWFSKSSAGDPAAASPLGGYLMVWYYAQECQPPGYIADAGRIIDGIPGCWDVWTGTNNGMPVISYKHQGMVQSMGYDLNLFIKDALARYPGYMNTNWYLTNIFTGFEIWKGGVNLESTSFCAEVN